MTTHDEMIAVIQAHKEGKTIQYRTVSAAGWWDLLPQSTEFDFGGFIYRIKPEPKVLYVDEYGGTKDLPDLAYHDKRDAILCAFPEAKRTAVKYVEVLED